MVMDCLYDEGDVKVINETRPSQVLRLAALQCTPELSPRLRRWMRRQSGKIRVAAPVDYDAAPESTPESGPRAA